MLNLLRSKENLFPNLKLGKNKTKPKRFVTLENLLGTFLQIRKDPTLTSLLFLVIICRYGEVFNLATIDYCSYLLDWVLSAFFLCPLSKKCRERIPDSQEKKRKWCYSHAGKQRRQRFSYQRFSREWMKRNLCTNTSGNQLCEIKGSEPTGFVFFQATQHRWQKLLEK